MPDGKRVVQTVSTNKKPTTTIGPYNPTQTNEVRDQRANEINPVVPYVPMRDILYPSAPVQVYTGSGNTGGMGARNMPVAQGPKSPDPQMQPGGYGFAAKYDNLYDPQNRPGGYGAAAAAANPPGPSLNKPVTPVTTSNTAGVTGGSPVPEYNGGGGGDGGGGAGGGGGYYGGYNYGHDSSSADRARNWLEGMMTWRW